MNHRTQRIALTLAATEVRDDGLTMHFESEMPKYNERLCAFTPAERGSGPARPPVALEDGTTFPPPGRWVRKHQAVVRVAEVSTRSQLDVTMNGTGKTAVISTSP